MLTVFPDFRSFPTPKTLTCMSAIRDEKGSVRFLFALAAASSSYCEESLSVFGDDMIDTLELPGFRMAPLAIICSAHVQLLQDWNIERVIISTSRALTLDRQ